MRIFVAICFDDETKKYVEDIQHQCKDYSIKGNFTLFDNFHLTVRFIGEVSIHNILNVQRAVNTTNGEMKEFSAILNHVGTFERNNKNILWVGFQENNHLKNIYNLLEKNLFLNGIPKEDKNYVPHVTFGREVLLKEPFSDLKEKIIVSEKVIKVKKIALMESVRVKDNTGGSELIYREIFRI